MGLGELYQADTDRAIAAMIAAPQEPPAPSSKWNAWSTPLRVVPAAAADVLAASAETATAVVRSVLAARDAPRWAGQTRAEREAADLQAQQGVSGRTEVSDALRSAAEYYSPDPVTAGRAEQLVFGLGRGLGKALGYGLTMGPLGVAAFAGDEGLAEVDRLQRQGVDDATAHQAGVVTALTTGAGALLPVAPLAKGFTAANVAKVAALGAVSGPAAFVAQQQMTRDILARAGYDKIAEQIDPLDPWGIVASAGVPWIFGGLALRGGARTAGKAPPGRPEAPPRAAGAEGTGDAAARAEAPPVPREAVDAAMVHNLTLQQDMRPVAERRALLAAWDEVHGNPVGRADDPLVRLTPDDVEAVIVERGPLALDTDGVTVRAGAYGIVKFIWKHGPESGKPPEAAVTREDLAALPLLIREYEPSVGTSGAQDKLTWVVDRPDGRRVVYGTTRFVADGDHHLVTVHVDTQGKSLASTKRPPDASAADTLQASAVDTADASFASSASQAARGLDAIVARQPQGVTAPAGDIVGLPVVAGDQQRSPTVHAVGRVGEQPEPQHGAGSAGARGAQAPTGAAEGGLTAAAVAPEGAGLPTLADLTRANADASALAAAVERAGAGAAGLLREAERLLTQAQASTPEVAGRYRLMAQMLRERAAVADPDGLVRLVTDRVATVEASTPDLVVRHDENGQPVTVAEEMARVRREAAEGTDAELGILDADLLRVAAECALTKGTA